MFKPLYNLVDTLYHGVMDVMPQAMQQRDMTAAALLGFTGTYALTRGIQKGIRKVAPGFDQKYMPTIQRVAQGVLLAAPVIAATIDPDGARELLAMHQTYVTGMGASATAALLAAEQDIQKRKTTLDEVITNAA